MASGSEAKTPALQAQQVQQVAGVHGLEVPSLVGWQPNASKIPCPLPCDATAAFLLQHH